MRCFVVVVVLLLCSSVQAAPYSVWELSGSIWARDEATGEEWRISRGENCHSPDLDEHLAVWIGDWSYPADVMLYDFHAPPYPISHPPTEFSLAVQPEVASDPQVSFVGIDDHWAYAAWLQPDGIWARRLAHWGDSTPPPPELVVPGYSGTFQLEDRTLTWDGGSMELDFPAPIPEPAVGLLLAIGIGSLLLHRRFTA